MLILHPPVEEGIKDEGYIDYFIGSALYGFLFTSCSFGKRKSFATSE